MDTNKNNSLPEVPAEEDKLSAADETGSAQEDSGLEENEAVAKISEEENTVDEQEEYFYGNEDESEQKDAFDQAEPEIPEDAKPCIRCEEYLAAPGSEYCEECQYEMRHTRITATSVIYAILIFLVSLFASVVLVLYSPIFLRILQGDVYAEQNRMTDAYNSYESVTTEVKKLNEDFDERFNISNFFASGDSVTIKGIHALAKGYSTIQAGYTAVNTFTETDFSELKFRSIKPYVDVYDAYNESIEIYQAAVADYSETEAKDIPVDKIIAELDAAIEALKTDKELRYTEGLICYMKYYVYSSLGKSDESFEELKKVEKLEKDQTWLYAASFVSYHLNKENYEEAIKYADLILSRNLNDQTASRYKYLALCYQDKLEEAEALCSEFEKNNTADSALAPSLKADLYRRKGDLKKSIEFGKKAVAANSSFAEGHRQLAIAYIVSDEPDLAVESINLFFEEIYYSQAITMQAIDTIALISGLVGGKDGEAIYDDALSYLDDDESKLSQQVTDCLNGKITVKEIFMEGKCDIV